MRGLIKITNIKINGCNYPFSVFVTDIEEVRQQMARHHHTEEIYFSYEELDPTESYAAYLRIMMNNAETARLRETEQGYNLIATVEDHVFVETNDIHTLVIHFGAWLVDHKKPVKCVG